MGVRPSDGAGSFTTLATTTSAVRWHARGPLLVVAAVILLVGVGWVFSFIANPPSAPQQCLPGDSAPLAAAGFQGTELRIYSVCGVGGDGHAWVHYVPQRRLGDNPMLALRRCANALIDEHETVTCYAYATAEAFDAAGVSADGTQMERQCWGATLRQTRDEGGQGLISNPDYESEGCPPTEGDPAAM